MLIKVVSDSGKSFEAHGKLIIGILVIEDFVAVILLAALSAASAETVATPAGIGLLIGKLILFIASALVLGGLLAPRIVRFVAKFDVHEALLIVVLGLCFGLALIAHQMGISAAAGAFLIGTVLGDSEQSEQLLVMVRPVRDMFAALFFVLCDVARDTLSDR